MVEHCVLTNGPLSFGCLTTGPRNGPAVLLLHGFPDINDTFLEIMNVLSDAGFWCIAPMMRGYEPSSQPPDGDYRMARMVEDVLAWIDDLNLEQVHLVGHDWGAAVGQLAAIHAPERFLSLTTMAVPHLPRLLYALIQTPRQFINSGYILFFQIPVVSDWAIQRQDWALVQWLSRRWSPGFVWSTSQWSARRSAFEASGVKQAMLSYYRQNLAPWQLWRMPSIVSVRTLAIAGHADGCMDTRLYNRAFFMDDFPKGLTILQVPKVGHFMHQENPERIGGTIRDWLQGTPPTSDTLSAGSHE